LAKHLTLEVKAKDFIFKTKAKKFPLIFKNYLRPRPICTLTLSYLVGLHVYVYIYVRKYDCYAE